MDDAATASNSQKTAARLMAVQALYKMQYSAQAGDAALRGVEALGHAAGETDERAVPHDRALAHSIMQGVAARADDISGLLDANLDAKWPLARLEKTLACILRAGVAELLVSGSVDTPVIINDYVNIAHGFFAGKEPALVNAVLDKIAKHVRS